MNDPNLEQKLDAQVTMMSFNRLHELGNEALKKGLIIGHGFSKGMYEILHQREVLTMSPEEAEAFLEDLLKQ